MRLRCPHCKSLGVVRTSERMSDTVSYLYVKCSNAECGHTWRSSAAAKVTISPSARPNPRVVLPFSEHVLRDPLAKLITSAQIVEYEIVGANSMTLFEQTASTQPTG